MVRKGEVIRNDGGWLFCDLNGGGGGPNVGCQLKFYNFVVCRLSVKIFDLCRLSVSIS